MKNSLFIFGFEWGIPYSQSLYFAQKTWALWYHRFCFPTSAECLTKQKIVCTKWWKSFRSSRNKCQSTTSICFGSFIVPHIPKWYYGHTTKKFVNCPICRWLFVFDNSTQSFPSTWKQLYQISEWLSINKLILNIEKTFYLKLGRTKSVESTLWIDKKPLKTESTKKIGDHLWFWLGLEKPRFVGLQKFTKIDWLLAPLESHKNAWLEAAFLFLPYQTNNRVWFISACFHFGKSIEICFDLAKECFARNI